MISEALRAAIFRRGIEALGLNPKPAPAAHLRYDNIQIEVTPRGDSAEVRVSFLSGDTTVSAKGPFIMVTGDVLALRDIAGAIPVTIG